MVGNSRLHCGCDAQRLVNAAEIIVRKLNGVSRFQVVPFLTECVRQPGEPPHVHPEREILALNMRRANSSGFRVSPHRFGYRFYHPWWRITVFVVRAALVHLYQLGIIDAGSKCRVDGVKVRRKAIGGDLKLSRGGAVEFLSERHCIPTRATAQVPRQYELGVPLHSDKAVGVTAKRIAVCVALLFAANVCPDFIALDIGHREVMNHVFEEPLAVVANDHHDVQDGVAVDACNSLDAPNRTTLDEQPDDLGNLFFALIGAVQPLRSVAVGLVALAATEALITLPVAAKFNAFDSAIVAGHGACLSCEASR